MPGNFKNDDLRILKTQKALMESLVKLLKRRNFNKITVNDLCGEAQISRVAFYSHFQDKYDLLKNWLKTVKRKINILDDYEQVQSKTNNFIVENSQIIINIAGGANSEVSAIVCDFIFSLFDIPEERDQKGRLSERYVVLHSFCSGGLLNLINWHIDNAFPEYLQPFNKYLHGILQLVLINEKNKNEGIR